MTGSQALTLSNQSVLVGLMIGRLLGAQSSKGIRGAAPRRQCSFAAMVNVRHSICFRNLHPIPSALQTTAIGIWLESSSVLHACRKPCREMYE